MINYANRLSGLAIVAKTTQSIKPGSTTAGPLQLTGTLAKKVKVKMIGKLLFGNLGASAGFVIALTGPEP
jgi:hypothetical protein